MRTAPRRSVHSLTVMVALLCLILTGSGQERLPGEAHQALLDERVRLQSALAPRVWPGWTDSAAPVLLKTADRDILIGHPAPPAEFIAHVNAPGDTVRIRPNSDTLAYRAAYPINGVTTIVMTEPGPEDDPARWVLQAVHEGFHVVQSRWAERGERPGNPFVGPYAGTHELSFPFPHDDPGIRALYRLEGEILFERLRNDSLSQGEARVTARLAERLTTVWRQVLPDSLMRLYKRHMEWKEGVARYVEREVARLAASPEVYTPGPAFRRAYPKADYAATWSAAYAGMLNPVRFLGEGVQGRVTFYYAGMAKAYLLDRLGGAWKPAYPRHFLDTLIRDAMSPAKGAVSP